LSQLSRTADTHRQWSKEGSEANGDKKSAPTDLTLLRRPLVRAGAMSLSQLSRTKGVHNLN